MPVSVSAKRALRGSRIKALVNKIIMTKLEVAVRFAKKAKSPASITKASSLADRAAKKHAIHKNKAARIKSQLMKLIPQKPAPKKAKTSKK